MQKLKRIHRLTAVVFSTLTLGSLLATPHAARADDVPIIVGKPIIKKDPPQPKKDGELTVQTAASVVGQTY